MHSIINAAYCAHFRDFDLLLDVAHATGTGIELGLFFELPELMAELNAARERFRNTLITLHGPMDVEAASAPGTLESARFEDWWKRAFEVYHRFEAQSIVLHTHKMHGIDPAERDRLRGYAAENIQKVGQLAVEQAVRLTVENVGLKPNGGVLFDEDQFISLFDSLPPQVGCLIDVGHALINRWDLFHVLYRLNSRIFSFHLHNNNGVDDSHRPLFEAGNHYMPGEMEALLALTSRFCPDADWIAEYAPGEHISREMLKQDLQLLQKQNVGKKEKSELCYCNLS